MKASQAFILRNRSLPHRVAITNHRIQHIDDEKVTFQYKDYKDKAKKKSMTLQGSEFLRRFCLHILPKGFRKVRKYGMVSNASKKKALCKPLMCCRRSELRQ